MGHKSRSNHNTHTSTHFLSGIMPFLQPLKPATNRGKIRRHVMGVLLVALGVLAVSHRLTFSNLGPKQQSLLKKKRRSLQALGEKPLYDASVKDPWKKDLYRRLDRIRENCGALCSINDQQSMDQHTTGPGKFFPEIEVPVDCDAIMGDQDVDVGDQTVPYPPPEELVPYYGMNGLVHVFMNKRIQEIYLDGKQFRAPVWDKEYIDSYMDKARGNDVIYEAYGNYTNQLRDTLAANIDMKGKQVLVIGTQLPWVEAICLYLGAAHVTTLEYGTIDNQHPNITTVTPSDFRKAYQRGKLHKFDVVVSFSSLEHPGLGRYGDALNPWGDILGTARARCVTKKGGYLVLAVPTGQDTVHFNLHRMYGKHRYALMGANWKQMVGNAKALENHRHTHQQPTFIFQNP